MDSFNKENIIISQDDISTPLRKRNNSISKQSPLRNKNRSQHTIKLQDSFILPDTKNEEFENLLKDYQNLERQMSSIMIQNNNLAQENQNFEMELLLNEKNLLMKSSKINELIISNKQLEKNLTMEIRNNEQNYSNWISMKQQYENKISNLNNRIKNLTNNNTTTTTTSQDQITINNLTKKLKSLKSDYDLEKNSKMLIIDEFEIVKQNYLNLELNYNLLKNEFDKLQQESSFSNLNIHDEIEKHQQHDLSFGSDSSYGDIDVENVYTSPDLNLNLNSKPPQQTLADELNESEIKYQYNQELIKLNFQIKSLNLQNEKLYSYIGYLLQNSLNNNKEYSDEKLIKIAKRKLVNNKILRSVSSSLQLHLDNRSEHPLMVYPDHATNEEMSIFLENIDENKRIYNIKSTANLKKLHFSNNHSNTIIETVLEDDNEFAKLNLTNFLNDKSVLRKLNLIKFLIHGIIEFVDQEDQEVQEDNIDNNSDNSDISDISDEEDSSDIDIESDID